MKTGNRGISCGGLRHCLFVRSFVCLRTWSGCGCFESCLETIICCGRENPVMLLGIATYENNGTQSCSSVNTTADESDITGFRINGTELLGPISGEQLPFLPYNVATFACSLSSEMYRNMHKCPTSVYLQ